MLLTGTTRHPSKQTDESNLSTRRKYCTARKLHSAAHPFICDPIGMRCEDSCEEKKGVRVVLRVHMGGIL